MGLYVKKQRLTIKETALKYPPSIYRFPKSTHYILRNYIIVLEENFCQTGKKKAGNKENFFIDIQVSSVRASTWQRRYISIAYTCTEETNR